MLIDTDAVCGMEFNSEMDVYCHQIFHGLNIRPFQCGICFKRFELGSKLTEHLKKCREKRFAENYPHLVDEKEPKPKMESVFSCSKCEFTANTRNKLIEHFNQNHLSQIENVAVKENQTKIVSIKTFVGPKSAMEKRKKMLEKELNELKNPRIEEAQKSDSVVTPRGKKSIGPKSVMEKKKKILENAKNEPSTPQTSDIENDQNLTPRTKSSRVKKPSMKVKFNRDLDARQS